MFKQHLCCCKTKAGIWGSMWLALISTQGLIMLLFSVIKTMYTEFDWEHLSYTCAKLQYHCWKRDRQMDGWLFYKMLYNVQTLHCMPHSSREREHSVTEWLTQASCTLIFQISNVSDVSVLWNDTSVLTELFCCVAGWMCTDTPQLFEPTVGMLFTSVSCAVS